MVVTFPSRGSAEPLLILNLNDGFWSYQQEIHKLNECCVTHDTMKDKNSTGGSYLFSQTVPQILLLAKESHSIRLSYIRIALLSCFCKLMGHTQSAAHRTWLTKGPVGKRVYPTWLLGMVCQDHGYPGSKKIPLKHVLGLPLRPRG